MVKASSTKSAESTYTVNGRLLLVTVVLIALVAIVGYFWYAYQLRQTATALLARAEQLEQEQEWNEAGAYYQRYLLVEPEDTETLVRFAEVYSKGEMSPGRLYRVNNLLYRVLGRAPNRADLRLKLAENLLKLGEFEEAAEEAEKLPTDTPQFERERQRILALSQIAQVRVDPSIPIQRAIDDLLQATQEAPADVELIEVTANRLREHANSITLEQADPSTKADQLMDQLVESKPEDVEARLARYRYKVRHKLPDAEADLQVALQNDSENIEVLLLSAEKAISENSSEEELAKVETQLRNVIELAPLDIRAYLILAEQLEQAGKLDEAEQLLRQGQRVTGNLLELGLALANLLLDSGKLAECERFLEQLEEESLTHLAQLDANRRTLFDNRLKILNARLALKKGQYEQIITPLKQVFLSEESRPGSQRSKEWLQAAQLLATGHTRLEQWDNAAYYWDALVATRPGEPQIVEAAATAYLRLRRPKEAIDRIDAYQRVASSSEETSDQLLVQRVQAHLLLQLQRPPTERNWTEFRIALDAARQQIPSRLELSIAEVDFLMASSPSRQDATAALRQAEEEFSEQAEFWKHAASRYQQLGQAEGLERALQQYGQLVDSPGQHAMLKANILANDGKLNEADAALAAVEEQLSSDELRNVQRERVRLLAVGGEMEEAHQLASAIIDSNSEDKKLLMLGIEVALAADNSENVENWLAQLREVSGDSYQFQFLTARKMLQNFGQLNLHEQQRLDSLMSELRVLRPSFYPVVALAAYHAQMKNDKRQALTDYRFAVDLGDRRPFTLQQLITLLYDFNRYEEAEEFLSLLSSEPEALPFVESMSAELAIKQNRTEEALDMARQGVEKNPEEVPRRLYLANLLMQFGRAEEAIQVLREAVKLGAEDDRVWTSLFKVLVQSGHTEEARSAVESLAANTRAPLQQRHFVVAQGYELLGDYQQARKHYEVAVANQPTNGQVRLRYAKLLASRNPRAAQNQYERLLQADDFNNEARRELAILLASTGEEADWNRSFELLEESESSGNGRQNDLLRAILLSKRGRTRAERATNREAAVGILQRLIATARSQQALQSRLLLAQLFEQQANASDDHSKLLSAQEQFETAIQQNPHSVDLLSLYIQFLLRTAESDLAQLADVQREATEEDSQPLREVLLAEAEGQLEDLRQLMAVEDQNVQTLNVALTARWRQAQGQDTEARQYVDQFVEDQQQNSSDPNEERQFFTFGKLYSSLGFHSEAEEWFRRLTEKNPNAYVLVVRELMDQGKPEKAVDFCLEISDGNLTAEMAALLANVMTSTEERAVQAPEAEKALDAALDKNVENVQLLQAEAIMRSSRGDYDAAIQKFRRVIQLDPDNVLALNNLATILAERPNRRAEALELIERAISLVGRQPALLDTKGTICLKLGDTKQAITCLEEATAGGANDARYYLHLAAAYHQANRFEEALQILDEARSFGLERFVLTEDDRQLLNKLESELAATTLTPQAQL